jgi:hypothetical protein
MVDSENLRKPSRRQAQEIADDRPHQGAACQVVGGVI